MNRGCFSKALASTQNRNELSHQYEKAHLNMLKTTLSFADVFLHFVLRNNGFSK